MSWWGFNEREVGQPPKKTQSQRQSTSSDTEEYDYGTTQKAPDQPKSEMIAAKPEPKSKSEMVPQAATKSSQKSDRKRIPVEQSNVQPADLLDPLKTSLIRAHLRRRADQSFGFDVSTARCMMQVITVDVGGPAERIGLMQGDYLLAVDGKAINNKAEVDALEDSNRMVFRMAWARKRPSILQSDTFALPEPLERQLDCQYLYVRLFPKDDTKFGIHVEEREGKAYVSKVSEKSAGSDAGLRTNDKLLVVDGILVDGRSSCKDLLGKPKGNLCDMILEREPTKATTGPAASVPAKVAAPASPPEPNAGDPSSGVPQTPNDVSEVASTSEAQNAVHSIKRGKKKKGKSTPRDTRDLIASG